MSRMNTKPDALQAEGGQCPQPSLAALLPAVLDRAFKGAL